MTVNPISDQDLIMLYLGGSERAFVLTSTKDLVHTAFNYTRSPRPRRLPRRRQPRD